MKKSFSDEGRMFSEKRGTMLRNFTLIELLVVIAIIAILAAILLPTLQSARDRGKMASCAGHMKQLGLALAMYCDASGDWFPSSPGGNYAYLDTGYDDVAKGKFYAFWHLQLYPFTKSRIPICTAATYPHGERAKGGTNYAFNGHLVSEGDNTGTGPGVKTTTIEKPSETVSFSERKEVYAARTYLSPTRKRESYKAGYTEINNAHKRNSIGNVTLLDGSVTTLKLVPQLTSNNILDTQNWYRPKKQLQ